MIVKKEVLEDSEERMLKTADKELFDVLDDLIDEYKLFENKEADTKPSQKTFRLG